MPRPPSILLAGLGNTGSHLAPLLARMGLADDLILADPDVVEEGNLAAQAYGPDDVDRTKVGATAAMLRRLDPSLRVESFAGELEDLPLGCFSGLVILCLDQDGARQVAAERCWQTGGRLFDVAVNGPAGLARVTRIIAGADRACLECGWSDDQYANLPARHSCRKTPPTQAPAALGSFAASLAALWVRSGDKESDNLELVSSPADGEMFVTRLTRNPDCRFDHHTPDIEHPGPLDPASPLPALFDRLRSPTLAVPGFTFARQVRCIGCGSEEPVLRLDRGPAGTCRLCGGALEFPAFFASTRLGGSEPGTAGREHTLESIGLKDGDVVAADDGRWIRLNIRHSNPRHPHV